MVASSLMVPRGDKACSMDVSLKMCPPGKEKAQRKGEIKVKFLMRLLDCLTMVCI